MSVPADEEPFDRSRPLYRLFNMEDGGPPQWWTVEVDNIPGAALDPQIAQVIAEMVERAPWRDAFYAAYDKHHKATVYAAKVEPYEVPGNCVALIRRARFHTCIDGRFLIGAFYGDKLGRIRDGQVSNTSLVVSGPDEHGVVETINNTYKVELMEAQVG